jgi:hypothetical protein
VTVITNDVTEYPVNINPVLHDYVKKKKLVEDLAAELKMQKDFLGGLFEQIKALPKDHRQDDFYEVIEAAGKKSTFINMERFEDLYPDELKQIRNTLIREAKEQIQVSFPLGRTEGFLGKGKYLKIIDVIEGEPTLKVVERWRRGEG